jgi:hypothetical protein
MLAERMVWGLVPGRTQDTGSQHRPILMALKNRVHAPKASFQGSRPNLTLSSNFEVKVF